MSRSVLRAKQSMRNRSLDKDKSIDYPMTPPIGGVFFACRLILGGWVGGLAARPPNRVG